MIPRKEHQKEYKQLLIERGRLLKSIDGCSFSEEKLDHAIEIISQVYQINDRLKEITVSEMPKHKRKKRIKRPI